MIYSEQRNYKPPSVEEIRAARKKRPVVYMLTVYGDESCDMKQHVFAVAGVIGFQEEWDELEPVWRERNNGNHFHSADCESSPPRGLYKGTNHNENLKLYRDLIGILNKTKMMGFGVTIDLQAYREIFPGSTDNAPYYRCFAPVIAYFAKMGSFHIPQQDVKFIFHINAKVQYTAGELYDYMSNLSEWEHSPYLAKTLGFAPMDVVGIQVADLFARETMKCVDDCYFNNSGRDLRKSLQVLFDSGRFVFMHLHRNIIELEKKASEVFENKWVAQFNEWLNKNSLVDNESNRTRFQVHKNLIENKK